MSFDVLDEYAEAARTDRGGWRGVLGKVMTFAGFIVLANAVIVALLFRHLLSFRDQLLCVIIGSIVGVIGMILRGNKTEHIVAASAACASGALTSVLFNLFDGKYGVFILAGIVLIVALVIQKIEQRAWKNL